MKSFHDFTFAAQKGENMSGHNPYENDEFLDFELGAFGDKLKKVGKKISKGVDKVTDATIMKPTVAIMGAVGGKKGKELGKKIGGIASKVTKIATIGGAVAGAAPALLPLATSPIGAAIAGKVIKDKLTAKKKKAASKPEAKAKPATAKSAADKKAAPAKCPAADNALAARVGAMLVERFGKPLTNVNKALELAAFQRQATYEHQKLVSDSDFRKTVMAGLTALAANGHPGCARTVSVLVGKGG